MSSKHPHHEVITAYLEGKQVECKHSNGTWVEVKSWKLMQELPCFDRQLEYRIKPVDVVKVVDCKIWVDDYKNPRIRTNEHWEKCNLRVTITNYEVTNVELLK